MLIKREIVMFIVMLLIIIFCNLVLNKRIKKVLIYGLQYRIVIKYQKWLIIDNVGYNKLYKNVLILKGLYVLVGMIVVVVIYLDVIFKFLFEWLVKL